MNHIKLEENIMVLNNVTKFHKILVKSMHAGGSDFRLYDGSDWKTYLLMRW